MTMANTQAAIKTVVILKNMFCKRIQMGRECIDGQVIGKRHHPQLVY